MQAYAVFTTQTTCVQDTHNQLQVLVRIILSS